MEKQTFKRDWEMARIFLILAVLTAGFVFALQGLILTPVTTGRIPNYKSPQSMPLSRELHMGGVEASVLGTWSDGESLSLLREQPHSQSQAAPSKRRSTSSEAKDLRNLPTVPEQELLPHQ